MTGRAMHPKGAILTERDRALLSYIGIARYASAEQLHRTRRRETAPATTAAKTSEAPLPPDNELWDVHAAARFLKRSVSWVYHKAEDGTLPVKRLGGWGLRFIPGELRAWVTAGGAGEGPR